MLIRYWVMDGITSLFLSVFLFLLSFFIESNFSLNFSILFFLKILQDGDRYFMLNIVITEIFLHLSYGSKLSPGLLERFLEFIESSLSEKVCDADFNFYAYE